MPASPIPRSRRGLPTSAARVLGARPPTLAGSSPTKPKNGARWSSSWASRRTEPRRWGKVFRNTRSATHPMTAVGQELTFSPTRPRSAQRPKADIGCCSAHVRNGPCVDGSGLARRIFTSQHWSEQPCVRPLSAVPMTAGHNALRGSGPGQKHAFEDAMARVGCPDRRIDRHCITCCSPSQPLRHAGCPARCRYAASAAGSL
jgi:hypothetical protein